MNIEEIVQAVLAQIKQQPMTERNDETLMFSEPKSAVDNPKDVQVIEHARSITPARIGIGRAGTRMKTAHYLHFRVDHAAAQDAVYKEVNEALLEKWQLPILSSKATDLKQYLMDLPTGRKLDEPSVQWILQHVLKDMDVQIIISNGLSSAAIEANIESLLPALLQGLKLKNIAVNPPIYVKRARVWLQDEVAKLINCKLAVILIGERPGLNTAQSLSAYLIYKPNENTVEADRTVISNIHENGLSPSEAGAYLSELIEQMLALQCTGVSFMRKKNEAN